MQHYTKQYAEKMLELNPDWMAIGVSKEGYCYSFNDKPSNKVWQLLDDRQKLFWYGINR